jgi:hypothetical protein
VLDEPLNLNLAGKKEILKQGKLNKLSSKLPEQDILENY